MDLENEIKQTLSYFFYKLTGCDNIVFTPLSPAGSNRKYYRLTSTDRNCEPMIGTYGPDKSENEAFCYLAKLFSYEFKLNAPRVFGQGDKCYLQDDLGDTSLFDLINKPGEISAEVKTLIVKTIRMLADFQWKPLNSIYWSRCYPVESFDERSIMWDLNYFKYCFLKNTGIEIDENKLEDDFIVLTNELLKIKPQTIVLRDFQSRNIMIKNSEPYVIDFQGSRRGPCQYDLVSFLWQVRAGFSKEFRNEMINEYLDAASRYHHFNETQFRADLDTIVLFRSLQVLGAYGFRGLVEKKPHFVKSLIPAVSRLSEIRNAMVLNKLPYIRRLLSALPELPMFAASANNKSGLTVTVNSFGFRKSGIPHDLTGNGGGFVFDCRGLPNPGRYPEFSSLTGMDCPVVQFLEGHSQVEEFLKNAFKIVDISVQNYLERNFTDLTVNFGCTGGQHRSVYCAERMANYINSTYGVDVMLNHTERGVSKNFISSGR
ncbi:MAG: phosphotransferase [Muribaculum sp.]|nr:phosphotransferase [Muribaculaceae bacterium]MCM1080949.1 phosphotransferase [Muribaculum sp.]